LIDISFEINGRKVSPNKVGDVLEKAALENIQSSIKKAVGSLRCPMHNRAPRIVAKGRSIDKLNFEVYSCCEELVDKISKKLS
jgi:hypothetical protein